VKRYFEAKHLGYESLEGKRPSVEAISSRERQYLPLLIDCLKSEWDPDAVSRANAFMAANEINGDDFIMLARKHFLPPLLWKISQGAINFPKRIKDRLKDYYLSALMNNSPKQRFERAILSDLQSLEEIGISYILLKGAGLAQLIYEDPAVRYASDIDVIVSAAHFPLITEYLQTLGYDLVEEDEEIDHRGLPRISSHLQFRKLSAEMSRLLHRKFHFLVEFHVSPVGFHYRYAQDWAWLWENDQIIHVDDYPIRVLNHEARFLNLCAHLIVNHDLEDLRHTYEIAKFCHLFGDQMNWVKIFRLARKYEFAVSIRRVIDHLDTVWSIDPPAFYPWLCRLFPPRNREQLFFDHPGWLTFINRVFSEAALRFHNALNGLKDHGELHRFHHPFDPDIRRLNLPEGLHQNLEKLSVWLNEILNNQRLLKG
jgi:hypothetical protein